MLVGFSLVFGGAAPAARAQAKPKETHPHIHHALHELRDAKKQLEEAAHDYGGIRAEALRNTDVSIFLLEKALQFDKGAKSKKLAIAKNRTPVPIQPAPGERHPHIRRALYELREAKRQLLEAAHDFGGFRSEAIRTIDVSIFLLEKALQFDAK